ncbi:Hypothetical protein CFH99_0060 [Nocardioides aromaticivorans]|uniref:Uncharacterized protein n=1 Tax=Nocardioides aromaticivorans TaxID=200618 RepID=A0ABX7PSY5_9ACTN|nr:Hypothetical protein CFH99_0060 [Nocardioides aromaticivorans]
MSVDAAVAAGRLAAESRMTSRCTVRRKTGASAVVDGFKVAAWAVVHADLPVRVGGASRGANPARRDDLGSGEVEVAVRTAHFPYSTADLADSDYVEVTSGENAGLVVRIVEATWQDQATARRVPVVSVVRPEEWT